MHRKTVLLQKHSSKLSLCYRNELLKIPASFDFQLFLSITAGDPMNKIKRHYIYKKYFENELLNFVISNERIINYESIILTRASCQEDKIHNLKIK